MNRTALAMIVATLGTLAMLAVAFDVLPRDLGMFAVVGLSVVSGMVWWLPWRRTPSDRDR